ncbi:type VI secretion system baseplate subunit TssK [Luteibacter sp. PPL552]
MSGSNKVVWSDGLFLRPEHFQQTERYLEHLIELRHAPPGTHAWGFDVLDIDHDLLSVGRLALRRARGVFPDGTPFSMPDRDPLPPPLALESHWRDRTLHLALGVRGGHAAEIAWEDSGAPIRFIAGDAEGFPSLPTGEEAPLQVARMQARLVPDGTALDGCVSLPLARLTERRADGGAAMDDAFIPCVRRCAASPRLMRFCDELLASVVQRGDMLASRSLAAGPIDAAGVRDLLLLQAINRWQPRVAHIASQPSLHPEALWCVLATMAGELATFSSPRARAPSFTPYRHDALCDSFDPVIDVLRAGLQALHAGVAVDIPLRQRSNGIWVGALHEAMKAGCTAFALGATSALDPQELRRRLPLQAKLGPAERLRDLVNLQLPGIPLVPLDTAPRGVFSGVGWQHFAIDTASALWTAVQASRVLALHVGEGLDPLTWRLWGWKA